MQRRNAGEGPVGLWEAAWCAGSDLPGPELSKLLDSGGLNQPCVQCGASNCDTSREKTTACGAVLNLRVKILFHSRTGSPEIQAKR